MAIDNANAETRYAVINASTREYNLGFILREKSGVVVTRIRNGVSIVINPDDCTIENGKITLSNRVDIMAGDILVLSRVTPDTQEVILTEGSELPAKTIEYGFDRAAMRCAELDTKIENVRKYSLPTATVTQTATGATITVTDKNGTTTANVTNGKDGSYTLPAATAETLGGVKVNNSTGALKVAQDGLLALLVSSPEAMKNGATGIAVNLKTNGGLMFQTVTYGDPTKALGMSPKATYNQLSGSSVTITPSVQPYKLTASGATTLNSSYSFGINDGVVSTGDIAYAEIVIVLGASGSITAGMDLTLVDALVAGKTNYCAVRWEGEQAKLFLWRVE